VAGVALWFYFIPQLAELVTWLSPKAAGLDGDARIAAETPRQIANAHAVFNISNTLVFIGLAGPMAWLVTRLIPDRASPLVEGARPKFIDDVQLETPALALDMARRELGRLGAAVLKITRKSLKTVIHGSRVDLDALWSDDAEVDGLHAAIIEFLGKLSQENLDDRQSDCLRRYLSAANYFESIGDMVETSLVDAGRQRCDANLTISQATEEMLVEFHREVCEGVDRAIRSLVDNDADIAAEVIGAKRQVDALTANAERHLSKRLVAGVPNRIVAFRLESEIIEYLKRMFYFAKRIAKLVATDEGGGRL
jgi:phosphate:Na+ symporter